MYNDELYFKLINNRNRLRMIPIFNLKSVQHRQQIFDTNNLQINI